MSAVNKINKYPMEYWLRDLIHNSPPPNIAIFLIFYLNYGMMKFYLLLDKCLIVFMDYIRLTEGRRGCEINPKQIVDIWKKNFDFFLLIYVE